MPLIEAKPVTDPLPLRERLADALAYPAQLGALSTAVALALAHLVAELPLGFIVDLIVWAAFFKYAFEVLRWSANGRDTAPEISFTVGDGVARYAMLLLVLGEAAIILLAAFVGPVAAALFGLLLTLALPAIMIVLALEEGAARALNPLIWLLLIQRIGSTYFVLVGAFALAVVVQSLFARLVQAALPVVLAVPLVFVVVNYLMLANFRLIGRVIHERADELGYGGHAELADAQAEAAAEPAQRIVAAARARAASGDAAGAASLLRDELKVMPKSLPLNEEYRHWLRAAGEQAEVSAHAKILIGLLLGAGLERRAIDIAHETRLADPAFALDSPEQITRLSAAAAQAGQTQLALALLNGFHKRFRDHADIGRNYLLAAKLLAERMNKEMPARALLQQIKLTRPDDAVIAEVDAYLAYLDQLAATPARSV